MKFLRGFIVTIIIFLCVSVTSGIADAADADAGISATAYEATVECGMAYGISPEFLQALIEAESSGNPKAINGGCKGLCQIYEKYHYDRMAKVLTQL